MTDFRFMITPNCPSCLTRCYKSQGCYYCDDCGVRVEGRARSRIYNSTMSNLEERMENFAPVVTVIRDGVEVRVPMDEFMAHAGEIEPGQAPA